MEIKYCIPSRGRAEGIKKYTINFLLNNRIKPKDIFVFINPKEQVGEYLKHKVDGINYIPVEKQTKNISQVRNYILNYFDEGDNIIMLDDDVQGFIQYNNSRVVKEKLDLNKLFKEEFNLIKKLGFKLFGFEPVGNYLNLYNGYSLFGFAIQVFGIIITKDRFLETLQTKEDIYFSCLNKDKYGGLLLDYRYSFRAIARTNKGGCNEYRNKQIDIDSKNKLLLLFPDLLKQHPKRVEDIMKKGTHKRYFFKKGL